MDWEEGEGEDNNKHGLGRGSRRRQQQAGIGKGREEQSVASREEILKQDYRSNVIYKQRMLPRILQIFFTLKIKQI